MCITHLLHTYWGRTWDTVLTIFCSRHSVWMFADTRPAVIGLYAGKAICCLLTPGHQWLVSVHLIIHHHTQAILWSKCVQLQWLQRHTVDFNWATDCTCQAIQTVALINSEAISLDVEKPFYLINIKARWTHHSSAHQLDQIYFHCWRKITIANIKTLIPHKKIMYLIFHTEIVHSYNSSLSKMLNCNG